MTHRDTLEAFNRATHSDALPEMQLAETTQPVEITGSHCWAAIPLGFVLIVILTVIGANTL